MLLLGDIVIINRIVISIGLIEGKKSVKLFIISTIWYDLDLYHGVC